MIKSGEPLVLVSFCKHIFVCSYANIYSCRN